MTRFCAMLGLLVAPVPPLLPDLNSRLHPSDSTPWTILFALTLITLLPAILMCMTPLVRLMVVFHFLRQALGTQTAPSNPTLLGLGLVMTWFLMTPVLSQVDQQAVEPYRAGQVADSALGSVVTQLTQALSLATRANNGTMNSSDLKSIASQLSGIVSEVESLANTTYQGQYIFAGGFSSTAPFTTTGLPAVTSYAGDGDINFIHTPNGQKIQLNVPGDTIFTAAGANSVFGALNALVADYSSDPANIAQATVDTEALNTALNYLSQQRVVIDNSITQLTAASQAVTNEKTELTAAQTNLMQADLAKVATQLSLTKTQQTALEAIISQLGSGSLFDKL